MAVVELRYRAIEGDFRPETYPVLGILGLVNLFALTKYALSSWTNPSIVFSYLIYGFCVSLPFIPRLDEKHPGFLGHQPPIGRLHLLRRMRIASFSAAMASMVYFMRYLRLA